MFSEDAETDMFAATPVAGRVGAAQPNKPRALADNFDDAEGYYNFQASIVFILCALKLGSDLSDSWGGTPAQVRCCNRCVVAGLIAQDAHTCSAEISSACVPR